MVGAGVLNLKMSADQNEDGWLVRREGLSHLSAARSRRAWDGGSQLTAEQRAAEQQSSRAAAEQQLFSEFIPPT